MLLREQFKEIEAWRTGGAVPARNIAWKKPSFLRNNDGTKILPPSVGEIHASRHGNDGDRNTSAVACYEYAWTYEVDFLEPLTIRKVVVHFGNGYPTEGEAFAVEPETGREISLGRLSDGKGESWTLTVDPVKCCSVRIRSYKPDGPDQPGGQMAVAELEVYE